MACLLLFIFSAIKRHHLPCILSSVHDPSSAYEAAGGNRNNSIAFFDQIEDHINERWASLRLCNIQQSYIDESKGTDKHYATVGFQWKPYQATLDHHYAVDGLRRVASEGLKVLFLTRNPLDRYISNQRHSGHIRSAEVPAHCKVDDADCIKRHQKYSKGIVIQTNTSEFLRFIRSGVNLDIMVENRLKSFEVDYLHVTYEKLYDADAKNADDAEEWMRIFRFLGVGPKEGLTVGAVRGSFELASTSLNHHNETIANYKEVKSVLEGTEFEKFLH